MTAAWVPSSTCWDGITEAAGRQNGKKSMPITRDINKVCVIEEGALCGAVLEGSYNLTGVSYKTSQQNMVNRVMIINEEA